MNQSINQNKKETQNNYSESMLKGRMAETLVEELLKKSGNTVYRFGYEAIMQNLVQIKQSFDAHSDAGERIRAIPDFIVIDKNGEPIFVEVKFRWNGMLHEDDQLRLKRISNFWSAKIIFVNSTKAPFFMVSSAPYVDEGGQLICRPLSEETAWKIDPAVYEEFESLVKRYITPPLKVTNTKPNGKKETYIKCIKCGDEIYWNTHKNLTPCNCGAISVDGCEDYIRIAGKKEDYEEIQK